MVMRCQTTLARYSADIGFPSWRALGNTRYAPTAAEQALPLRRLIGDIADIAGYACRGHFAS